MNIPKVENMQSANGNDVPNQFIIQDSNGYKYFQSYGSIIAKIENDGEVSITFLDSYYWNYSRTTSKYRRMFLNESTKRTQEKIDSGEYKLVDLNK